MTDQEIVARFMEPKPPSPPAYWMVSGEVSTNGGWWMAVHFNGGVNDWVPRDLTLDALRKVETRLTAGQRPLYHVMLIKYGPPDVPNYWSVLHADAEQKIKALAAVLRPLVEGEATR